MAPVLPSPVVPIARRVLREMVGHLVVDARPDKLGPAIAAIRESGAKLNLNLLGEAVLGEEEALRRLEGIHALIRRPDVDYVSVKVSAIASHISMWAFDEVVDKVVERLMPLYLTRRGGDRTFINLDMEEYRDLDLTIAVFTRILEDPRLRGLEAGIVLQAYLPDALPALQRAHRLGAAARRRRRCAHQGPAREGCEPRDGASGCRHARLAARDLRREGRLRRELRAMPRLRASAREHGGGAHRRGRSQPLRRRLRLAARRRGPACATIIEFEMLLGMAQGQVAAIAREVGHVLLYVPVVRPDEFDVAISYLVRRLEENASSDNFLSAAFDLADDPAMFERERDRFLASLERAADPALALGAEPHAGPHGGRRPSHRARARASASRGRARRGRRTDAGRDRHRPIRAANDPDDTSPIAPAAAEEQLFGGERVRRDGRLRAARVRRARALGAPGFRNAPDTDPALPANRAWAREILGRIETSTAGDATIAAARVTTRARSRRSSDG